MNRMELKHYIEERYGAAAEAPWVQYPNYLVYRHANNQKWFALIMDVPGEKLGLAAGQTVDIVDLKCDPILAGSLRTEPGILPAYHMNKERWISVLLDGSVSTDTIKMLIDMSFDLTATHSKPKKKRENEDADDDPREKNG